MEAKAASLPRARGGHQPCAACKMLRRKCDKNCVLSPYFPMEEIEQFAGVYKIFGASNVIKMIQMVDEAKREDAVKAMVYEAKSRLRDPVYGSAGTIFHLQKMVEELRSQLDTTSAHVSELQARRDELEGFLMNIHYLDIVPNATHYGNEAIFNGYHFSVSQDYGDNNAYDYVNFQF